MKKYLFILPVLLLAYPTHAAFVEGAHFNNSSSSISGIATPDPTGNGNFTPFEAYTSSTIVPSLYQALDGSNNGMLAYENWPSPGTGDFTVCTWAEFNASFSSADYRFLNFTNTAGDKIVGIDINWSGADGSIIFEGYDGTTFYAVSTSTDYRGTMHRFCGTQSNGIYKIYVDGSDVTTGGVNGGSAKDFSSLSKMSIFQDVPANPNNYADELSYFNSALSPTELSADYNSGNGIEYGSSTPEFLGSNLQIVSPNFGYAVPQWDKMIFLAQNSSTGVYQINLNYWDSRATDTIAHTSRVFSAVATTQGGTTGFTSFVSVPMVTSFVPPTSTYFWNATLSVRVTSTELGIGFWDPIAFTSGSQAYDTNGFVPNTSSTYGTSPSSTYGAYTVVYGSDARARFNQNALADKFKIDCSVYSGGLFSSSTVDALGCYGEKVLLAVAAVLVVPGQFVDTPTILQTAWDEFKTAFPFSLFFSTMDDIRNIVNTPTTSSSLSIVVPMPGASVSSTNILIASSNFGRSQVGEHLWAQYTNLFILGAGILSIAGIVAWVFML